MARLNEPPVSMDTLETLRRRMLRQNRDLAKSNNIRAQRIRELENECAGMLSENLELRGRILELEKEAEDNDSRRIADHALAIKDKLESQLTEWGTLLAGLGLEPPMKRHSPHIRRVSKQRLSFSSNRPSPGQRRLRDVARDIEELGHISEHKATSRMSMNHEQILALRTEVESIDTTDSPELGPPPVSQFIDSEPVKVDSPTRPPPVVHLESSPKRNMDPPITLPSPKTSKHFQNLLSPEKKRDPVVQKQEPRAKVAGTPASSADQPIKIGSKRKLSARDEIDNSRMSRITDENRPPRVMAEKSSIREKAGGKTLKELANMRKESRDRPTPSTHLRKVLGAKSTNNDVSSPKKAARPVMTDDIAAAKADLIKSKAGQDRPKPKSNNPPAIKIEAAASPAIRPPATVTVACDLGAPIMEAALFSPSSPEPVSSGDGPRGDTPPPADITSNGETTRPSRRNKTAISYAEPNLRDKMRRPSKQLFDAVAGEGKNNRRSSQCEPLTAETVRVKRESDIGGSWRRLPAADISERGPIAAPGSPLAGKGSSNEDLPSSVATERRRRPSVAAAKSTEGLYKETESSNEDADPDAGDEGDVDVYEFTTSSPHNDSQEGREVRKKTGRKARASRRFSAAINSDDDFEVKERGSSRRRSMML